MLKQKAKPMPQGPQDDLKLNSLFAVVSAGSFQREPQRSHRFESSLE